jgi:flagellar motor switch protein FliN
VSVERALVELAASTAEAVTQALGTFLPDGVEVGAAEIVPRDTAPLDGISVPAIAADASYGGGASGGNLFVTTLAGARTLAAAMMGTEAEPGSRPLDELERSAIAEAMNQMMAEAAEATSRVLGQEVEISAPEVRNIESVAEALVLGEGATHATTVPIILHGEPCRFIQLVPKAFVLKMSRALDDLEADAVLEGGGPAAAGVAAGPDAVLRGVQLRVCAEIGRARMPLSSAVSLPDGGLVELDRGAEEPVDVLVNGRRFAVGRLVLVEDEGAVRIEEVLLGAADLAAPAEAP